VLLCCRPAWCVIDKFVSFKALKLFFQLKQEQFQERWCASDILAHTAVSAAGGVVLHVHVPRHLH
jgi:hypothetical protein